MHRTTCKPMTLWWGILAVLLVGGLPGTGTAQPTGTSGTALIVPINGTQRLQMASKKPIKTVTNTKDTAISIRTVANDPTSILITGQQPDVTRLELEDVDGKKESYEIIVQLDVEYLRTSLRRTVPTADITPIPTSNNAVILTGNVTRAEDVQTILNVSTALGVQPVNAMRVGGVQQVQLDVVVAIVSRDAMRAMAFNFLTDSRNFFFGSTVGGAVGQPALVGVGSATLTVNGVLAGVPGAPNGANTNILAGVLHNSWGLLTFLQALRNETLIKLVAEPHLMTLSGRPASFLSGGEQAIPVPAGLGQIGVQFEEFGTRLNFLPIVLGNGKIHLEVEPEISELNAANGTSIGGTVVPGRTTNRVNTTVELEAGQTFVLGGLIQHRVTASTSKTPILGDLPFLGALFNIKSYDEEEDELLIMVTPFLVDASTCDQLPKYLPGQETRSPDDFELFLEGILEAPRGSRQVFQNRHYVPAFKNSPTTDLFPCGNGGCGPGGCRGGAPCGGTCGAAGPEVGAVPQVAPGAAALQKMPQAMPLKADDASVKVPAPMTEAPPAASAPPAAAEPPAAENAKPTTLPPAVVAPGSGDNPK